MGPWWYDHALARMQAEGRRGLVFIVPRALERRRALGEALLELALCDEEAVADIYRRLVAVCLTRVAFRPGNVVLLSPEARVLASATWSPEDARPASFVQRFGELLDASPGACRVRYRDDEPPPERIRRLPFGTELPGYSSGCSHVAPALEEDEGDESEDGRLVVECGMAYLPPESREFLRFLTEPPPGR